MWEEKKNESDIPSKSGTFKEADINRKNCNEIIQKENDCVVFVSTNCVALGTVRRRYID